MSEIFEYLPTFGARAAELVAGTEKGRSIYIRVRTGEKRQSMARIGRIDLQAGETFEIAHVMREVQQIIEDGRSNYGHLVELVEYDPGGRVAAPVHTVFMPPTQQQRTQESMDALQSNDSFKAMVAAVVSMAQSADARADRESARSLQLMELIADKRVEEAHLQGALAHQAPAKDPRLESAELFFSVVKPLMPTIQRAMDDARTRDDAPNTQGAPPSDPPPDAVHTGAEVMDALLQSLADLTEEDPTLWDDPARKAAAAGMYASVTGGAKPPEPADAIDAEPPEPLTDGV